MTNNGNNNKFLDYDGLVYLWEKIINAINSGDSSLQTNLTTLINNIQSELTTFKLSKGKVDGWVPLESDKDGGSTPKISSNYLPSYVDDVIEGYYNESDGKFYSEKNGTNYSGVLTGQSGKIFVDLTTGKTYRYGSTTYVEISKSIVVDDSTDSTSVAASTAWVNDLQDEVDTIQAQIGTGSGSGTILGRIQALESDIDNKLDKVCNTYETELTDTLFYMTFFPDNDRETILSINSSGFEIKQSNYNLGFGIQRTSTGVATAKNDTVAYIYDETGDMIKLLSEADGDDMRTLISNEIDSDISQAISPINQTIEQIRATVNSLSGLGSDVGDLEVDVEKLQNDFSDLFSKLNGKVDTMSTSPVNMITAGGFKLTDNQTGGSSVPSNNTVFMVNNKLHNQPGVRVLHGTGIAYEVLDASMAMATSDIDDAIAEATA